jgi:chemotaxis protein CheD
LEDNTHGVLSILGEYLAGERMTNLKVVGIGEWLVSNNKEDMIRTYALGSCVALVVQHPVSRTCGLVHIALPDSFLLANTRKRKEGYCADTAVPALLEEIRRETGLYSAMTSGLIATLAGGARMMRLKNDYHIGERIVQKVLALLQRYKVPVAAMDVGGEVSRTVSLAVGSGEVFVASPGTKERLLK